MGSIIAAYMIVTLVLWKVTKIGQLFPYMDLKDYMITLFYHNYADGTDLEF